MKEQKNEKFGLVPPEIDYISSKFRIKLPIDDTHFSDPWKLRIYAAKLLQKEIGDEVQLTTMKVKRPLFIHRLGSRLFGRVPNARLYITIKF